MAKNMWMDWTEFEFSIKNNFNEIGTDDSIRIIQWDGINEFVTINSMPNLLVDY